MILNLNKFNSAQFTKSSFNISKLRIIKNYVCMPFNIVSPDFLIESVILIKK